MKPNASALIEISWEWPQVVAHRGAAAYQPENTLPAFEEAISCGALATECDVHLSVDGEIVVIHDDSLDRTTSLSGLVRETSLREMQVAGVPSLAEVTAVTKDRIVLVIEIKDGDGIERMVVEQLRAEEMGDQVICFSFDAERVARVKALEPSIVAIWLVAEPGDPADVLERLAAIGADGFGVMFWHATPELVAMARERRVPVFVWTVPPGPGIDHLVSLRVNFIITDHPRDVLGQLGG